MKKLFLVALLFSLLSLPSWSQVTLSSENMDLALLPDFDPSFTYQVKGEVLNKWKTHSMMQQEALKKAESLSASLETNLNGALQAVTASQTSFETYKNSIQAELLVDKIIIGSFIFILILDIINDAKSPSGLSFLPEVQVLWL